MLSGWNQPRYRNVTLGHVEQQAQNEKRALESALGHDPAADQRSADEIPGAVAIARASCERGTFAVAILREPS
jgi:hypothetical protein